MTLHKRTGKGRTPLTPEDEDALLAEWEADDRDRPLRFLRHEIDRRLKNTNVTILELIEAGLPHDDLKKYRQELRDLPKKFPDGLNVVWPVEP